MSRIVPVLIVLAVPLSGADGQEAASERIAAAARLVAPTQLRVERVDPADVVRYDASVVDRDGDLLLLLTAAHCVLRDEAGGALILRRGDAVARGRVVAVAVNPSYPRDPRRSLPGADNALLLLRLDPEPRAAADALLDGMAVARLTDRPVPPPEGGIAPVFVIDQFGRSHAVRGLNLDNPRWLAWGKAYWPIPGDSGSGVFIFAPTAEGRSIPILVGVVTDRNPNGGGSSLLSMRDEWVARFFEEALPRPVAR